MTEGREAEVEGFAPTPIDALQPGDIILVDLPVEADITVVDGTKLIVRHRSTGVTHVVYTTTPTLWKRVEP